MCEFLSHFKKGCIMKEKEWYQDRMYEMRRELAQEQERLADKAKHLEERMQLMDAMDGLLAENSKQQADIESLQQQLAEERQRRDDVEMKLAELNKLTAGVARKASEEVLLKTIQSYVNKSKQKRPEKRAAAKEWALEMVLSNKLNVPEELAAAIEALDDEQPAEPRTVVNGDLVQNKHVENEIDKVEPGATGITINKKQA